MFKKISLLLISGYQKYISPYKGYSCAYRVHANGLSCSAYGKKVIEKHGLMTGLLLLNRRFYDCSWHYEQHKKTHTALKYRGFGGKYSRQRGFVDGGDMDCSGCEDASCEAPACHDCNTGEACNFAETSPDWGECLGCASNMPDDDCNIGCCSNSRNTPSFKEKRDKKNKMRYPNQVFKSPEPNENTPVTGVNLDKSTGVDLQKKDV